MLAGKQLRRAGQMRHSTCFLHHAMMKMLVIVSVLAAPMTALSEVHFAVTVSGRNTHATDVRVNKSIDMTVVAEWPQETHTYVIYAPSMPELRGMQIANHYTFGETLSTASQTLQRIVHHFLMAITNPAGGKAETGPIRIDYRRDDQQDKTSHELAGITVNVLPAARWPLAGTIAGACTMLSLAAGAVMLKLRRCRLLATVGPIGPSAEDGYLAKLDSLRQLRLAGELDTFFSGMEALLRDYLKEKYVIGNIETWCANETGPAGPDEVTVAVARELLGLAHQVRYGNYRPGPQEQQRMFDFVKSLLTKNQPRRPAPEVEHYLSKESRHD